MVFPHVCAWKICLFRITDGTDKSHSARFTLFWLSSIPRNRWIMKYWAVFFSQILIVPIFSLCLSRAFCVCVCVFLHFYRLASFLPTCIWISEIYDQIYVERIFISTLSFVNVHKSSCILSHATHCSSISI